MAEKKYKPNGDYPILQKGLGKSLNVRELAQYLRVDEEWVRKYYNVLGGARIGKRYLFFENLIVQAIEGQSYGIIQPKEKEMDSSGEKDFEREAISKTKIISQGKGCAPLRGSVEKRNRRRVESRVTDPHNLLT